MLSGFTKITVDYLWMRIVKPRMATAFECDCKPRKFDCKLVILLDRKRIVEKIKWHLEKGLYSVSIIYGITNIGIRYCYVDSCTALVLELFCNSLWLVIFGSFYNTYTGYIVYLFLGFSYT